MPTASEVVSRRCGQRSYNDDIKRSAVDSRILIMTAALIMTSITIWGCTGREVVQNRLHSGGGGMIHSCSGGAPLFFPLRGGCTQGGVGCTPLYPECSPPPPNCQCHPECRSNSLESLTSTPPSMTLGNWNGTARYGRGEKCIKLGKCHSSEQFNALQCVAWSEIDNVYLWKVLTMVT